jgi:hypothetical protein
MREGWFSPLTSSQGICLQEKWFAAVPMKTRNDEEGGWSSPLSTGHSGFRHKNHLRQQPDERRTEKIKRSAMAAQTSITQGQRPPQPSTPVVLVHPHHGA